MRDALPLSKTFRIAGCLLLSLLAALPGAYAQKKPPALKPVGYVNDFANVLSQTTKFQLTALCTEVDQKAHAQIAIVTVQSLEGRPIEEFSIELASKWGIGPKQSERGVMILLAVEDRRYRFEVGYGLESILPDGKTGGIGREAVPYLREGNYDAAVRLMTQRVADVIAQDRGVVLTVGTSLPQPHRGTGQDAQFGLPWHLFFPLAFLAFMIYAAIKRSAQPTSRGYRRGRGWWIGPMMGGGGGWGGGGFGSGGGGGGGFGGFGGGSFGGGGSSGSW